MGVCCSDYLCESTTSNAEVPKVSDSSKKKKQGISAADKVSLIKKTAPKLQIGKNGLLANRKDHTPNRSISNLSTEGSPDSYLNDKSSISLKNQERCQSLGPGKFMIESKSFNSLSQIKKAKKKQKQYGEKKFKSYENDTIRRV